MPKLGAYGSVREWLVLRKDPSTHPDKVGEFPVRSSIIVPRNPWPRSVTNLEGASKFSSHTGITILN
jgi:hypothetical protein